MCVCFKENNSVCARVCVAEIDEEREVCEAVISNIPIWKDKM